MLSTFIGAVIGILGTLIGGQIYFSREKRSQVGFAAAVLYNDLVSIEGYLRDERSPVNLRYFENWQYMVAYCSFLTAAEIKFIYKIYDEVYNYNYHYKLKAQKGMFKKEDLYSYEKLLRMMFDTLEGDITLEKNLKNIKT